MDHPRRNIIVLLLTLSFVLSSFMVLLVSAQSTTVAAPTFNPPGGTYSSPQTVILSTTESNGFIRYTVDGSVPSDMSPLYLSPIVVSTTTTIKALTQVSLVTGLFRSDVVSATYTIASVEKVATPTFSPAGGSYSGAQSVEIQCATSGAIIRYTMSGDEPSSSSTEYSASISVSTNTTIKAKAFLTGWTDSDTGSATYTIIDETKPPEPFPINTAIYVAIVVVAIIAVVGGVVYLRKRNKSAKT